MKTPARQWEDEVLWFPWFPGGTWHSGGCCHPPPPHFNGDDDSCTWDVSTSPALMVPVMVMRLVKDAD